MISDVTPDSARQLLSIGEFARSIMIAPAGLRNLRYAQPQAYGPIWHCGICRAEEARNDQVCHCNADTNQYR
jgi:hypothetical protein